MRIGGRLGIGMAAGGAGGGAAGGGPGAACPGVGGRMPAACCMLQYNSEYAGLRPFSFAYQRAGKASFCMHMSKYRQVSPA